ncbi:MAG: hypothetical protein ACSW8H_00680 [bacterium]
MKKEAYEEIVLEVVEFAAEDLILSSTESKCPYFDPEKGIELPII